jgi:ubiquinol-cytochrome c reductase cytochrome c subunit
VRLLNRSAGRLSRHRRGPLAGLVVVLFGLLVSGGLYAAFAPASADETTSQADLVQEGRQLFITGCSTCHGENGEGVLTQEGNQLGPPLSGVGAAAVDFQVGTGLMPLQQPGAQAPEKERVYSDRETAALAAYVASLGPGPAIPDETDYDVDAWLDSQGLEGEERAAARQEAITKGGQIFLTNCTACHNMEGSGGAMPRGGVAPKIRGVEPKYIYEAMLTGPQSMDNFSNGNIPPESKRDVIAYLEELDESPSYGGFAMGNLGPVSDGIWVWLVGLVLLVGAAVWIASSTTRTSKTQAETEPDTEGADA